MRRWCNWNRKRRAPALEREQYEASLADSNGAARRRAWIANEQGACGFRRSSGNGWMGAEGIECELESIAVSHRAGKGHRRRAAEHDYRS